MLREVICCGWKDKDIFQILFWEAEYISAEQKLKTNTASFLS